MCAAQIKADGLATLAVFYYNPSAASRINLQVCKKGTACGWRKVPMKVPYLRRPCPTRIRELTMLDLSRRRCTGTRFDIRDFY